jgi:NADH-quinone oxidoreductase subunit L
MSPGPLTALVLLPLAGFLLNGTLSRRLGPPFVTAVGCGLPLASFALAVWSCVRLATGGFEPLVETAYAWARIGDSTFEIAFWFDRLSALMTLVVTGVGSLIHVYSTGYMKDDPGYARYFAYLNLFLFFMLLLVLGRSLLVCFVGWEGVGLASYLLIGFWFEDADKARAGLKAFVTNRVGDAGFLLGIFLLYHVLGTLEMDRIQAAFTAGTPPAVSANLVALLLFAGATAKSAQIPLHVWLPDAMAGPTPVSALIHAATMVTAGVYLLARLNGVYAHAPEASALVAGVGAATAFFAATVAVVQTDIKKVLAYSTISQLGFMFVALGVGAYGVAVFHLYTHAFFKACLFLGAGSVIHALAGEQDLRRMGGLARRLPVTFWTFAIATAAIAGLPPLSGFWSKDEILWYAFAGERGSPLLWAVCAATALLTAFYMFRLLWLAFLSPSRLEPAAAHHAHESPPAMSGVLIVLAAGAALGGFVHVPAWLGPLLPEPQAVAALERYQPALVVVAVVLALLGLAAAWRLYARGPDRAAVLATRRPGLHGLLTQSYRIDALYAAAIAQPFRRIAERAFLGFGDRWLIDGSLHGLATAARRAAGVLARVETGQLQLYVLLAAAGVAGCLAWIWRHA